LVIWSHLKKKMLKLLTFWSACWSKLSKITQNIEKSLNFKTSSDRGWPPLIKNFFLKFLSLKILHEWYVLQKKRNTGIFRYFYLEISNEENWKEKMVFTEETVMFRHISHFNQSKWLLLEILNLLSLMVSGVV
jgi:hypothetical protein